MFHIKVCKKAKIAQIYAQPEMMLKVIAIIIMLSLFSVFLKLNFRTTGNANDNPYNHSAIIARLYQT
jgi:hypothetical protein